MQRRIRKRFWRFASAQGRCWHVPITRLLVAAGMAFAPAVSAHAMWVPDGVSVCGDECVPDAQKAIPDGAGGAFIVWRDARNYPLTGDDIYAQRITSLGTIAAGWPAGGLPVCNATGDQTPESIAPDGEGGFLVSWYDTRHSGALEVYAQRVRGDGAIAAAWPVNGAPTTSTPSTRDKSVVASDGSGGGLCRMVGLD